MPQFINKSYLSGWLCKRYGFWVIEIRGKLSWHKDYDLGKLSFSVKNRQTRQVDNLFALRHKK